MSKQIAKKVTMGYKGDILGRSALPLSQVVSGTMDPREFSTGSVGFNYNGKASVKCGKESYTCSISLNVTVAHSKAEDPQRISADFRDGILALAPHTLKDLGLEGAEAEARTFTSGKVGFYCNQKTMVNGLMVSNTRSASSNNMA